MPFEADHPQSSTAVREMKARLSKLETEEGRVKGLISFQPSAGDVIIVTPPKSGTTLVCQIVQSLRSRGDMSFEEINLVIPCLEMAYDYGYRDLNAPQGWNPRVYKTHAWYPHCPRGGEGVKYVYVVRNPVDAAISFYHFFSGWFFEPGTLSVDTFIDEFVLARGKPESIMQNASLWHNIASWWDHRHDPNVLWLFYEDLVADLAFGVDRIATFLGFDENDKDLRALTVKQASIESMKRYPTKYDEHMLKEARNVICGLDPKSGLNGNSSGKVRQGGVGKERCKLLDSTLKALEKKWEDVVMKATGCSSYDEMHRQINEELN